ncbi:MAG: hypothetical protein NTZ12_08125 [Candidatus Aminicenantes bacterium]|nr:hypothetical protein [Candidatus Aminicenantes bacterium]
MNNKIEIYDQKRKNFRGGYILGDIVFLVAFIVRSAMKISGKGTGTLWTGLHVILVFSLLWLAYFSIRLLFVERTIRRDPVLNEALHNELDRLNELKAWRIAFFSLIILNLIATYLFHIFDIPLRDPIILIITSLLVGFGSFDLARYLLDR